MTAPRRRARLLLLSLLTGCAATGLGPRTTQLPPDGVAELPVRLVRGVFLLHAELAGDPRPQWLLLDTGTDRTLLDLRLARRLGLQAEADEPVVTATGHAVPGMRLRRLPRLRLGAAEFTDVDVTGLDLGPLRELGGLPIAGIAGCDLFRQCLLEIDYPNRSVRLLPRDCRPPHAPHRFAERTPTVTADIAGTSTQVLIDTGFQQSLAMPPGSALPWRSEPRPAGDIATIAGTAPKLSAWLDGNVRLGEVAWEAPWLVLVPGVPKIGARLLRSCVVVLDAAGGSIWVDRGR